MKGYGNTLLSVNADAAAEELDIPTFLRRVRSSETPVDTEGPRMLDAPPENRRAELAGLLQRINRRLDHRYACIETVASLSDLKRYGLPEGLADQLAPLAGKDCKEACVVVAFLNKLTRHPDYESLLSPRVRQLIQDAVREFGVTCVQLEACIQAIISCSLRAETAAGA
ncbi:MAG TPA: hypothetical protein VKO20_02430 [Desulfosalsimonadaceae bacterium]|nr:hypothetical protein [Desulfosalsimonadaceae bacterium]